MFASRGITATRGGHRYTPSAKFKNIKPLVRENTGRNFQ